MWTDRIDINKWVTSECKPFCWTRLSPCGKLIEVAIRHCFNAEVIDPMNMLPFTIKTTDQATMHLCRITPPEQHEELDVEVGFLLRSWEIHHLHALRDSTRRNLTRQILNEVPNDAYKMFIRFLRGAAEPEVFLPTVRLDRYLHRQYCLLLSSGRVRELFEVYNRGSRHSRRLINFSGYDLIVGTGTQLLDTEAYLIAPNKYTIFLRQVNASNEINVYHSDFIDLAGSTPPPLVLESQDVIDTVRNSVGIEIEGKSHQQQHSQEESPVTITTCPECDREVQRIGGESYFCLECNWDNLPALS